MLKRPQCNLVAMFACALILLISSEGRADALSQMLAKHGFDRQTYKQDAINLLMGNTEMGGLSPHSGTGFNNLWMADLWSNDHQRRSLAGPILRCSEYDKPSPTYGQKLNLQDGVLHTRMVFDENRGYESTVFFSQANKNLLVIQIHDLATAGQRNWNLELPVAGCDVSTPDPHRVKGVTAGQAFTRYAWVAHGSKPLNRKPGDAPAFSVNTKAGETVTIRFGVATHFSGGDFPQRAERAVQLDADADALLAAHRKVFQQYWDQLASISIPDENYERLFYRSVFWMLCTAGSERFLPGESQFAVPCWNMRPFTYGGAGWATQAYTHLGLPDHARRLAENHFKPGGLRKNAAQFLEADKASADTWSFAHEVKTDGTNHVIGHYYRQRHLDGFAASMFHRTARYYPDENFTRTRAWPVVRGTAEFWRNLVYWDERQKAYVIPPLLSVSENLTEKSVLDCVLAAKFCLTTAAGYARQLNCDPELRKKWRDVADKLYLPETAEFYREFLGADGTRAGGGYFGVRAMAYLGYPTCELIPTFDREKVNRTLDGAWKRNQGGSGMISFVANWFALADTYHGRGDHVLGVMRRNLQCLPEALAETGGNNPYFLTSYASFAIVPVSMMVQSYNERIWVFPAVPKAWKNVSFHNVPAEFGIRVSGEMKDGRVQWVSYSKDGKELLRLNEAKTVQIIQHEKNLALKVK